MIPAPRFWANPPTRPGWQSRVLRPLSWIWIALTRRRLARGAWHDPAGPVICVGNLTVGGTGKTPTVMALVQKLQGEGRVAHVVTRGHGGRLPGPVQVDERTHGAVDVGDEALLIAPVAPVWVAHNRAAGADAAFAAGADIVVLDDGFQNPGLRKHLSMIVVDAVAGFGNGCVIPAGPLREPVAEGLKRADLVLLIGSEDERDRFRASRALPVPIPVMGAELRPLYTGMSWDHIPVLAFAGIGRPGKFFKTLRGLGAEIRGTQSFADHEPYTPAVLRRLEQDALRLGAQLVTTEKDMVRLPAAFRRKVLVVPVRLEMSDWSPFDALWPPQDALE